MQITVMDDKDKNFLLLHCIWLGHGVKVQYLHLLFCQPQLVALHYYCMCSFYTISRFHFFISQLSIQVYCNTPNPWLTQSLHQ